MGKTRTAFISSETRSLIGDTSGHKRSLREEKGRASRAVRQSSGDVRPEAMPAARIRVPGLKGGERVVSVGSQLPQEETAQIPTETITIQEKKAKKKVRTHGKKYLAALTKIDPKREYSLSEAITLARNTSISQFPGKLELHIRLTKNGGRFEVQLPHPDLVGTKRVEIANEETLKKIEAGKIDFDVLLSTPDFVPSLVPFAKILGPRGLMPNPKNGTITEDPEKALEKFNSGAAQLGTEKDFPNLHTVIGKVSDEPEDLFENTQAIFNAIGPQNIKKAVLSPTMGPGVKVAIG